MTVTGKIVSPKGISFRDGDVIELEGDLKWNDADEPDEVFMRIWVGDKTDFVIAAEGIGKVFDVKKSSKKAGRAKWRGTLKMNTNEELKYLIEVHPRNIKLRIIRTMENELPGPRVSPRRSSRVDFAVGVGSARDPMGSKSARYEITSPASGRSIIRLRFSGGNDDFGPIAPAPSTRARDERRSAAPTSDGFARMAPQSRSLFG